MSYGIKECYSLKEFRRAEIEPQSCDGPRRLHTRSARDSQGKPVKKLVRSWGYDPCSYHAGWIDSHQWSTWPKELQ